MTECWLWTGGVHGNGYGCFPRKHGTRQAHRAVYEALVGPVPDGMEVDHLCSRRLCVRPDHLEVVTPAENKRRTVERGRARGRFSGVTVCQKGHGPLEPKKRARGTQLFCRACERERDRARKRRAA